jgi:quercetin dioxygenase-like cupin family protein
MSPESLFHFAARHTYVGPRTRTKELTMEWFAGSLLRWHVVSDETGGTFTLGEALVRPGGEPPVHVHAREDETFYVLEGKITFQRGHERIEARPGDAVLMPRGVQHGFAVRTETARLLQAFTPGGLEEAFKALSEPAAFAGLPPAPAGPPSPEAFDAMTAKFAEHGVEFTGPPLT